MKKRALLIALTLCAFAALTQVISQEVANPEIEDGAAPKPKTCYKGTVADKDDKDGESLFSCSGCFYKITLKNVQSSSCTPLY